MSDPRPVEGRLQRARGTAHVRALHRDGASRIAGLRQAGSMKALFPRTRGPALEGVLVNTAGGITGGDRLEIAASAERGAYLSLTTQAAERIYRATGRVPGQVDVTLAVDAGGRLDWLPQETILFEGSSLTRTVSVALAADARFLSVEAVILGRQAMGETLSDVSYRDIWRIRRGDDLVYADTLALSQETLDGPATLAGEGALATILMIAPDADRHLPALRAALPSGGASLIREDLLIARATAEDAYHLRREIVPALTRLRAHPLPKLWML